jgi:ATP-dependent helicase HrpB
MMNPLVTLPIDSALPEILAKIATRRRLVLVAQPGAGKTTRVAPAILRSGLLTTAHPNLVLLQPRRVATRSVAARIGEENGWQLGEEVGYQVRFEKKIGPRTRIKVMTEGILNRQLVADPFLDGVGAVLLDEFHERSIHTDLALALLREIQESVRDDLILVVMSATLDAEPVAKFLGDAPIVRVEGRAFPVEIRYRGASTAPLPDRMASAISEAISEDAANPATGDLLAFLPGVEEIRRTGRQLQGFANDRNFVVLPLHGSLPTNEQDLALRPHQKRKIVLSTNIAETSVTIDGITTVVDSGLARVASFDPLRGIDRLELKRISKASATQRAGRAGRTKPGRCLRLWSEREERGMPEHDSPEIQRIDLAATLLAIHSWGQADPSAFRWFEAPSSDRLDAADKVLKMLGAVDRSGKITRLGDELLACPAAPRLAMLLREASRVGLAAEGAAVAAMLSERDFLLRQDRARFSTVAKPEIHADSDLWNRLDLLAEAESRKFSASLRDRGIDPMAARRIAQARDDLARIARRWPTGETVSDPDDSLALALLAAFPDRVCRRRKSDPMTALMVGGRGIRLEPESVVREAEFFLALDPRADDRVGAKEDRVRIASAVRPEWLEERFPEAMHVETIARFDDASGKVSGVRHHFYRDLIIEEHEHVALSSAQLSVVIAEKIGLLGWSFLDDVESASRWVTRYELLVKACPEFDLPEFDEGFFHEILPEACRGRRSLEDVKQGPWLDLLKSRLTYAQTRLVEDQVPEALEVPSGNRIKLTYERDRPPVLAVRLQELFGWTETPRIAQGRVSVVLHLLGPNYRPVQITDDLKSFWGTTYFQVRKDLRNRYPKHSWPENPLTAKAEARGNRRPS